MKVVRCRVMLPATFLEGEALSALVPRKEPSRAVSVSAHGLHGVWVGRLCHFARCGPVMRGRFEHLGHVLRPVISGRHGGASRFWLTLYLAIL